ncbi:hypothetical protein EU803_15785 [Loktanella sp. IMCC34160]|uniref:hypothetical protein n=1 Tax=Loktanella sp. IMCC34160 TaxID=2510646 RepID=UPI00101D7D47|nr:hypothetical protein [Loktanella sp. IMCC34160]RYG90072.1 hypothetical protein EU803_15785 [Loktanella sp. IMCC34160]
MIRAFPRDSETLECSKSRSSAARGREFELNLAWKRFRTWRALIPPPALIAFATLGILQGPDLLQFPEPIDDPVGLSSEVRIPSAGLPRDELRRLADVTLPAEAVAGIAANSLFLEDRRPWTAVPEPEPEIAPAPPPTPVVPEAEPIVRPDIQVLGFVGEGLNNRALVFDPTTGKEQWLRVGDSLGGWTVVEIHASGILLRSGEEEYLVRFNSDG